MTKMNTHLYTDHLFYLRGEENCLFPVLFICFLFYPSTRCLAGFTGHRCERAVLKRVSNPNVCEPWSQPHMSLLVCHLYHVSVKENRKNPTFPSNFFNCLINSILVGNGCKAWYLDLHVPDISSHYITLTIIRPGSRCVCWGAQVRQHFFGTCHSH